MAEAPELPLWMRRDGFGPVPELGRARDAEGVVEVTSPFGLAVYVVTRHEDIRRVFADAGTFSSARASLAGPARRDGMLIMYDPPEHTRLRKMLTPEFTAARMRRLEPRIAEIVGAALDEVERAGKPADLVPLFAVPVPSLVICELLGVPFAGREGFQGRSARMLDLSLPQAGQVKASRENRRYMAGLVARAQAAPGEDMLGMLVREHKDDLGTEELAGVAGLLLLAGHERSPGASSPGDRSSSPRSPPPTVTAPSSRTRRPWTSPAAPRATSPSATACTTASGHPWPAWRCASPSPRCCAASPASPWPTRQPSPPSTPTASSSA